MSTPPDRYEQAHRVVVAILEAIDQTATETLRDVLRDYMAPLMFHRKPFPELQDNSFHAQTVIRLGNLLRRMLDSMDEDTRTRFEREFQGSFISGLRPWNFQPDGRNDMDPEGVYVSTPPTREEGKLLRRYYQYVDAVVELGKLAKPPVRLRLNALFEYYFYPWTINSRPTLPSMAPDIHGPYNEAFFKKAHQLLTTMFASVDYRPRLAYFIRQYFMQRRDAEWV